MKAITQDRYGEAEVLAFADTDRPATGPDDVLVRVHAAPVDQGVWHTVSGLPYLIRLAGYGFRAPKVTVPGMNLAGTVEEVGANVTRFAKGDRVFGTCQGAYAEFACADVIAPMPANVTFEQAATVPTAACTALQGLRDKGKIRQGQHVLVIGAAGGVGTFAVQLAKAYGATVTGVCSTSKVDLVRTLGADHVIDYTAEDITGRYDLILDTAGHRPLSTLRRALNPKGTLVIVGSETGGRWTGGVGHALRAMLLSPFVGHTLTAMMQTDRVADLELLRDLIEQGKVTPVIDRTFPLSDAATALRHIRENHARGKVVLTVQAP
ncbi:NAD(P)-dependent alcohol dehydrogenase [Actinokineospora sp. 24-640]